MHLGVSKDTIYTWISRKRMPARKAGRSWKFQKPEVDEWIKSDGVVDDARDTVRNA